MKKASGLAKAMRREPMPQRAQMRLTMRVRALATRQARVVNLVPKKSSVKVRRV